MYHHRVYNLGVSSEIELPYFPQAPAGGDVVIRLCPPDTHAGPPPNMRQMFHVTPRLATLSYAGLGTLVVRDGRAIDVRLLPDADTTHLALYLAGIAMAVLLYQRGLLVLRASAVAVGCRAVVLIAGPLEGESALAAALCRQGHTLLADGITAIDMAAGHPMLIPALTYEHVSSPLPVHPAGEKPEGLRMYTRAETMVPLQVIYDIQPGDDNNIAYIPLQAGLAAISRHSYPTCLLQPGGIEHLRLCSRLVGAVAVCELTQGPSLDDLPELTQMIEGHVTSIALAKGGRGFT